MNLVLVGAAGHATSVLDIAEQCGEYRIAGLLDRFRERRTHSGRYRILGREEDIVDLCREHGIECVAIGIGDNWVRSQSVKMLEERLPGLSFVTLVHPSATISPSATLGRGTVVMAGAIVNANSRIGEFCIVNTKASLDHDCVMEDFASLAPGVTAGGGVRVGAFSAVGLGANLIHKRSIGKHTVVGAGATVLHDLPDLVVAYGTPAQVIRARQMGENYL